MQFASIKSLIVTYWRYLLGGLIIVALLGYFFFGRGASVGATLRVTSGDFVQQASVSGTVIAARDVNLGFAANGRILGTYARVGQYVDAGEILAETENGELVAALSQKRSALVKAQANLASLQAGTRPEEVAVASASVASATSALVNAVQNAYTASDDAVHNKVDVFFTNPRTSPNLSFSIGNSGLKATAERNRAMIEPTLISWAALISKLSSTNASDSANQSQTYLVQVTTLLADANSALNQAIPDQTTAASLLSSYITTLATARTAVNTAATILTSDSAALDSAKKNLTLKQAGATSADVAAENAAVSEAEADVRSAQATLAKTRVVAPFGGTVTRMDAKVGEIVSPSTSLISMQSNGVFEIETYVPEVTIARIAPGNSATTTLDAYGTGVAFAAVVISVDPAETMKDGVPTYKTTLAFLKADTRIRSGMTANVVIETGVLHNAIVIPAGAVRTNGNGSYVSVIKGDSVLSHKVTTGPPPALGQAEILSGLSSGDAILLTPAH